MKKQLALGNGTTPRTIAHNNSNASRATRTRARRLARWQATFLQALRKSPNIAWACRKARINRTTAYRHREDNESFAAKWEDALSASVDRCEEKAFNMAWKGDSQLLQFILKAHRGERYRDVSRVEIDERFVGVLVVPEKEQLPP
jgi:hypothetical protein